MPKDNTPNVGSAAAAPGEAVPAVDSPCVEVRRSSRRRRTVTAYRDKGTIVVLIPQHMSKTDEQVFVADMVRKVLAREARSAAPQSDAALADRAADLARTYLDPLVGQAPRPASIVWVSNQQRRWGSCTPSTGTIRLSHRLQTMPSWVVDYVIVHELSHLVEPTHSAAFWRLVQVYPDHQRAQGYLQGFLAGQQGQPGTAADRRDEDDDVDD